MMVKLHNGFNRPNSFNFRDLQDQHLCAHACRFCSAISSHVTNFNGWIYQFLGVAYRYNVTSKAAQGDTRNLRNIFTVNCTSLTMVNLATKLISPEFI